MRPELPAYLAALSCSRIRKLCRFGSALTAFLVNVAAESNNRSELEGRPFNGLTLHTPSGSVVYGNKCYFCW